MKISKSLLLVLILIVISISRSSLLEESDAMNHYIGYSESSPKQNDKNAYVSLIHGIDSSFRYRGFLYNALITCKALKELGSLADFIALVGYSSYKEEENNILTEKKNNISLPGQAAAARSRKRGSPLDPQRSLPRAASSRRPPAGS